MLRRIMELGISEEDAFALRRISMTLNKWYELECGTDYGHIERDDNGEGKPWLVMWNNRTGKEMRYKIADKERGALKRLKGIMSRYPELDAYVQGDPRGASLYIYKRVDLGERSIDCFYSSIGVALYK